MRVVNKCTEFHQFQLECIESLPASFFPFTAKNCNCHKKLSKNGSDPFEGPRSDVVFSSLFIVASSRKQN